MRRSPSSTFAEYLAAIHGRLRPRYRPEDVYLGNLLGRLEALNPGVTTMLDWFHCAQSPEHADAAVAALRDTRGRSIFCYGAGWGTTDPVDTEIRRVRSGLSGDGLVTMALGLRGPELTAMATVAEELKLAAELGLRTSVHIESGGAHRPAWSTRFWSPAARSSATACSWTWTCQRSGPDSSNRTTGSRRQQEFRSTVRGVRGRNRSS